GNVTRLPDGGPGGTAMFDPGFVSLPDLGNFMMAISVFNNNGNTADGAGTFQITDAQGDTISGLIDGTWIRGNLSTFFNGNLSNIVLANTSGDGTFNGSSGGSFSMNFGAVQVFEGSIVNLFTRPAGVGFFQENFTTIADLVSGEIVPAPGTLALLGLSGLVMARRRR
ncbi:MAG TPA: PEP-CTERM sorting domain-containing protein, partial [Phycisphaerales bacterium]|nr:PEP-CTERM sorting domain-containing protein [Phycisphaerales bacterium]